jgi:pheromone shutdown-related protein TraB
MQQNDPKEGRKSMSEEIASDIHRIVVEGKEIVLVGTAHISQDSVETVRRVIEEESPETVCIELDSQRYESLRDQRRWESLNLIQVIKNGQVPFLLANLALAAFQKRMGLHTGVKPGAELAAAGETAERLGLEVRLVDREIRTTLLRAWRKTGLWKKLNLVSTLIAGLFENQKLDEAELARLRQTDTLSAMLEEMGSILPSIKTILVDERDTYMAHFIRNAPGNKIVAIVGAAHIPGIRRQLAESISPDTIVELSVIPPKPAISKAVPWLFPGIVIALFVAGLFAGDWGRMADAAVAWALATGLLAALGTLIAFGHPLTIVSAFVAAPITTLHPAIGAGMVTGLVQAFVVAPTVRDMERVGDDLASLRGWWSNRMMRVLLVFFFSSLGASAGTLVALHWLKDLL